MGNRGSFILSLLNARGEPWRGDTLVRIEDDRDQIVFDKRRQYKGPIRFTNLCAVPRGRHFVQIKTQIHLPRGSFFNVVASTEETLGDQVANSL